MKAKIQIIVIIFLLSSFIQKGYGQMIKGYAVAGLNLSQVDGDEVYGFKKPGFNGGLGATIPFGKNWSVSLEVLFSPQGANQKAQYNDVFIPDSIINGDDTVYFDNVYNGAYKLNLNYVKVPILVQYTDRDRITAGAGFSYGQLVGIKEWKHGQLDETTTLNSGTYKKNDIEVLVDLRFRIYKSLKFNIRYSYSIFKIRTLDFFNWYGEYIETRDQYNNVLTFRFIYVFNEKPVKAVDNKNSGSEF
jgi:hypothetical protein